MCIPLLLFITHNLPIRHTTTYQRCNICVSFCSICKLQGYAAYRHTIDFKGMKRSSLPLLVYSSRIKVKAYQGTVVLFRKYNACVSVSTVSIVQTGNLSLSSIYRFHTRRYGREMTCCSKSRIRENDMCFTSCVAWYHLRQTVYMVDDLPKRKREKSTHHSISAIEH